MCSLIPSLDWEDELDIRPSIGTTKDRILKFLERLLVVIRCVLQPLGAVGARHAFQLWVLIASQHWALEYCQPYRGSRECRPRHTQYREGKCCTGTLIGDSLAEFLRQTRTRGAKAHFVFPGYFVEPEKDDGWLKPVFWDFASAYRILMAAFPDLCEGSHQCLDWETQTMWDFPASELAKDTPPRYCARKRLFRILEPMQQLAAQEVTAKARLAAQGRLPVELMDLLEDVCLVAEGLPTRDKLGLWEPPIVKGTPNLEDLVTGGEALDVSFARWKLREEFRCESYCRE